MADDILKLDLYEIIGTTITANENEIKKAYRKKALSCHPDKNPDNPKAAELFLQLSKALEILTDPAAKSAYDKVLNAKAQAKVRVEKLDARRKKFKDNLEAREEAFRRTQTADYVSKKSDEEKLKAEIERLKKEGSRLVEEENERIRQKIREEIRREIHGENYSEEACRVKIKWKVASDDTTNGGYNSDNLHRFLSKHGEISALVLSTTKKGRALVEFTSKDAAESAVNYELGLAANPLKLQGMWEKSNTTQKNQTKFSYGSTPFCGVNLFPSTGASTNMKKSNVSQELSFSSAPDIFNTQKQSEADYENAVLDNLKRAEERKRLIEEMKANDEKT